MSIVQIYDFNKNEEIEAIFEKLVTVGGEVEYINLAEFDEHIEKNSVILRLYKSYGKDIFPVTLIDGEVFSVEKSMSITEILAKTEISQKKILRAGIDLSCFQQNTSCLEKANCNGCGSHKKCGKNGSNESGISRCTACTCPMKNKNDKL